MTTYFAKDPTAVRLTVSAVVRAGDPGERGERGERGEIEPGGERVLSNGAILLMKRADNGHWGLPGGHVEPGESVTDATVREVLEETGWQIEVGRLIGVYSDPKHQTVGQGSDRPQLVNLCFEARTIGRAGEPTTPEETLAVGFFAPNELPQPFVPIHTIRIEDALRGQREALIR